MENAVIIGLMFVAMICGAVFLICWLAFRLLAFILRGLFGPATSSARLPANTVRCPREKCRADNRASANFCSRCGVRLKSSATSLPRQAAMW